MDDQDTIQVGAPIPAGATIGSPTQNTSPSNPSTAPASLEVGSAIPQGATIGTPVPQNNQQGQPQPVSGPQQSPTMVTPNPKGFIKPGNLSIWNRPVVQNADGTHSSEYSTSFSDDKGHEVLVPTIVNGKFLTPDGTKPPEGSPAEKAMFKAAWKHYLQTGEHLGTFDNAANADAYATALHNRGSRPNANTPASGPTAPAGGDLLHGTISATPQPSGLAERAERWADNVISDVKHGTDITGIGTVLKKMGAHGVYAGNPAAVGDFMASLPLGLLTMFKGQAQQAQAGKFIQGTKNTASGILQAATIPGSFVSPEVGEASAEPLTQAAELAGRTAKNAVRGTASAVGNVIDKTTAPVRNLVDHVKDLAEGMKDPMGSENVQAPLKQSIIDALHEVASDHGAEDVVDQHVANNGSMRDVVAKVADAIQSKASAMYKELDQATGGGRFQRFDEQLANIRQAIREVTGIDPDKEGELVERLNTVQDAKNAAIEEAKTNGVDPKQIGEANQTWKQAQALKDVDKQLKTSIKGQRPELKGPGDVDEKANPEQIDPSKWFTRLNNLYNKGRLHQAFGQAATDPNGFANELLRNADDALVQMSKYVNAKKLLTTGGKVAAGGGILGGSLIAGEQAIKHLFGLD